MSALAPKRFSGVTTVFAKGKAALESLAVGAAVVLCDARGVGPMVTSSQLDHLRPLNFGLRALRDPGHCRSNRTTDCPLRRGGRRQGLRLVRASAGRDEIVDQLFRCTGKSSRKNETKAKKTRQRMRRRVQPQHICGFSAPQSKAANAPDGGAFFS